MGEAYFYHLTRQSTDQALAPLLEKCLGQGWRILLRCPNDMRADWLDERLWMVSDESFIPHGRAGGDHDADQPILITAGGSDDGSDGFDCIIAVEGAGITVDEVTAAKRTCVMFDAADDAAINTARSQWKTMADAGLGAKYWSQAHGPWRMERQTPNATG